MVETGKKTMTGGRLKRLKKYLKNEKFYLHMAMDYQM